MDVSNTKVYEPKTPVKDKGPEGDIEIVTVTADEVVNTGTFNGNGQHKIYNKNAQISKDGFFKNYRLMEGMWYKYDANGILFKIKKYKAGRFIGTTPLPKQ
ncbi:MAG: hypothetical protein JKX68_03015 [Flavobacteriales bacterium]|nr:hypothetical protein [Flavobacteriales bacterium]